MTEPDPPATLPEADRPARRVVVRRISSEAPLATRPAPGAGKGCAWLVIGALGVVAIIAILAAGLVFSGMTTVGSILSGLGGAVAPPPQAAVVSTQTIVTSIKPLGQLVSISAQLAKADINVTIVQGVLGSTSFTTNHVAQGAVEAGIDLTTLTDANVRYDAASDTYTITLPPAQLTSCRVEYIRQYGYSGTILPVDRDAARLLAQYAALVAFRDDALEGGILTRAEQQAALVFSNLVAALTGSHAQIAFDRAAQPPLPPSCQPDIPGNWTYDAQTDTWTQPQ
ncbi:MAG: hypothetical protein Kow0077_19430 [Anaerolineae bacterium]